MLAAIVFLSDSLDQSRHGIWHMHIWTGEWWSSSLAGFGKCQIIGDPHYITFDGLVHHFQGKYTYILAQTIPALPDTLTQFSIEGMNYPLSGIRRITNLKEILINVYNHTVRFRQNKKVLVSPSLTVEHRGKHSLGGKHFWVMDILFEELKD